jgi:hypothetical protein
MPRRALTLSAGCVLLRVPGRGREGDGGNRYTARRPAAQRARAPATAAGTTRWSSGHVPCDSTSSQSKPPVHGRRGWFHRGPGPAPWSEPPWSSARWSGTLVQTVAVRRRSGPRRWSEPRGPARAGSRRCSEPSWSSAHWSGTLVQTVAVRCARRWRTRSVNAGLTWCFALRRGVWATGTCCRRCAVEAGPCPWSIEVPASGRWSGRSVHSPRTNRVTWSRWCWTSGPARSRRCWTSGAGVVNASRINGPVGPHRRCTRVRAATAWTTLGIRQPGLLADARAVPDADQDQDLGHPAYPCKAVTYSAIMAARSASSHSPSRARPVTERFALPSDLYSRALVLTASRPGRRHRRRRAPHVRFGLSRPLPNAGNAVPKAPRAGPRSVQSQAPCPLWSFVVRPPPPFVLVSLNRANNGECSVR